jgi:hypothetical protein
LRRSTRAKAIAAQHWSARRRFERDRISLSTLIASDLKSLTLATWSPGATEVCTPRIAAGFAAFRMGQVSFSIILLFAFCKFKRCVAFRTRDFKVWHRGFSKRAESRFHTLCSSERWRRVSFNHRLWAKALFVFKHNAIKPIASRYGLVGPECTPAKGCIQTFIKLKQLVYIPVRESCIKRLAGTCHRLQAWEISNHAGEVQGSFNTPQHVRSNGWRGTVAASSVASALQMLWTTVVSTQQRAAGTTQLLKILSGTCVAEFYQCNL